MGLLAVDADLRRPFTWPCLRSHAGWIAVLVPVWILRNLDLVTPRVVNSWTALAGRLLANAGLALDLYLVLFLRAPRDLLPRLLILYFIAGAFLLGLAWRRLYLRRVVSRYLQRRAGVDQDQLSLAPARLAAAGPSGRLASARRRVLKKACGGRWSGL